MQIAFSCLTVLSLACSLRAYAINPPQWDEFSKGEFVDSANVKTGGDVVAGYVRSGSAANQVTALYEVDCKADTIRVHSDVQRYRRIPVEGGGSVVQSDDEFRTVVPGSRNARIEIAICGVATRAEADRQRQENEAQCQRAKHEDSLRIFLAGSRLTLDESVCLSDLKNGNPRRECDKAGIAKDTSVAEYLHGKGIFLECEDHPEQSAKP